jgi:hypothetical protein
LALNGATAGRSVIAICPAKRFTPLLAASFARKMRASRLLLGEVELIFPAIAWVSWHAAAGCGQMQMVYTWL